MSPFAPPTPILPPGTVITYHGHLATLSPRVNVPPAAAFARRRADQHGAAWGDFETFQRELAVAALDALLTRHALLVDAWVLRTVDPTRCAVVVVKVTVAGGARLELEWSPTLQGWITGRGGGPGREVTHADLAGESAPTAPEDDDPWRTPHLRGVCGHECVWCERGSLRGSLEPALRPREGQADPAAVLGLVLATRAHLLAMQRTNRTAFPGWVVLAEEYGWGRRFITWHVPDGKPPALLDPHHFDRFDDANTDFGSRL